MSDKLVESNALRKVITTLRLPLPVPPQLARAEGAWEEKPLDGQRVFLGSGDGAALRDQVEQALSAAGATVSAPAPGESPPADARPNALVYDATGLGAPGDLRVLYAFFHPLVRGLQRDGRVVVLTRDPEDMDDPLRRSAHRAVQAFVRSLAKELGRKGITAQTLVVGEGADDRTALPLRFLLSRHSAFISAQPLHVNALVPFTPGAPYTRPLEGKVALVTGAARGIGAATARALAREGAKTIVMDLPADQEAAQQLAAEIGGTALACDITQEDAAATILAHVEAHHEGLDIVVHNAGITRDKTLGRMSDQHWDLVLGVNLTGWVRANEALLASIREGGRILALSSIGGIAGNAGQTNYGATKAGVIGYVQGLAPRVAGRGITVNAVAPGFIETRMTAAMPFGPRQVGRRLSCLGQGGKPEDIAEAIAFLASPGAAGVTGEVLRVCGGSFLGA